jgi:hypothetical protein
MRWAFRFTNDDECKRNRTANQKIAILFDHKPMILYLHQKTETVLNLTTRVIANYI